MKVVFAVVVLGLVAATALASPFDDFQTKFGKVYATPQEAAFRATVFNANLKRVSAMNAELIAAGKPTVYNVTMFMDLTNTEFRARYLGAKQPSAEVAPTFTRPVPTGPAVQKVDWRDKGVITAVKNQGQCGSCWAFSATETIESFWKLGGHSLTDLSPQQIVSCDVNGGDMGCQGGWTYGAYKYVENAGGLEGAKSYPYTSGGGSDGQCMFNSADIVARITGWSWAAQNGDESALEQHVTNTGPISICVDASSWQFYTGGVLTQCGQQIDHCVQAVGFDKSGPTPYWIVRNSWTAQWGINGYIHLEMGQNMCALADVATYVSV